MLQGRNTVLLTGPGLGSSSWTHSPCRNETALHQSSPRLPRPPFNSASMSLTVSDSSYKWYHAVFVLVCLAYFTVLYIHPCCHKWQGSLLVKQFSYDNSISEC